MVEKQQTDPSNCGSWARSVRVRVVVWEYRARSERLRGIAARYQELSDRGRRRYDRETELGRFDFLD